MITWVFRLFWAAAVIGFIVYLGFFVKLGESTAYQHLARIWQTEEAQDLREEIGEAGRRVGAEIKEQIQSARADEDEADDYASASDDDAKFLVRKLEKYGLADELPDRDEVDDLFKKIDQQVEDGVLTKTQARRFKRRISDFLPDSD